MKKLLPFLAALFVLPFLASPAHAYNGISVTIPMQLGPHRGLADGVAMVRVFNHTPFPVQCRVHFFPKFVGPPHNWLRVFPPGTTNLWATDLRDKNYAALAFCSGQANANTYTYLNSRDDDVWQPLVKERRFECVDGAANLSVGYWNYLSDSDAQFWLSADGKTYAKQTVGPHAGSPASLTGVAPGSTVTINAKNPQTGRIVQRHFVAPTCN